MFKCKNISRFLLEIECFADGEDGGDLVKRRIYPGRDFYTPEPFIDRRVAYEPEKPKVVTVMATPVPTAQEQQPIDLPLARNWVEPTIIIDENQDEIDGEVIESLAEHKSQKEILDIARRLAGAFDGEPNPHPRTGREKLIQWIVKFNVRHPDESNRIYNELNG